MAVSRLFKKALLFMVAVFGVLAAAGLVALDEMSDRLEEDHQRAKMLAQGLAAIPGLKLKDAVPPSNMIFIQIDADVTLSDQDILERLKEKGILAGMSGARLMRLVTHYWINDAAVARTLEVFKQVLA